MMFHRRHFLKSSAAGAIALGALARSHAAPAAPRKTDLPKFAPESRILFLGDSITDMGRGRDDRDRNHYLGHSYAFLVAAKLGFEMPGTKLNFVNRGVGGDGVAGMRGRCEKALAEGSPDLLSILIGVNDALAMAKKLKPEQWEEHYRAVIDSSLRSNPKLKIVLLDPFVLQSGKLRHPVDYKNWRDQIDIMCGIVARLAQEYKTAHVKTQEAFDAAAAATSPGHWIWDGLHPWPQGQELIARQWLQAASTL